MGLLGHKKYAILFKSVFAVLYVILLGSQLSIKFYLCANSPAGSFRLERHQAMQRKPASDGLASLLKHRKHASFSLDKRYHFKHFFVLLSPEVSCHSAIYRHRARILPEEGRFSDAFAVGNPRRGPPTV
jgi:hypothetical protein